MADACTPTSRRATSARATSTQPAGVAPCVGQTLWEVLGTLVDRRGRKGRQYSQQALLAVAIAAMLAGADDLRAIYRWGRRLKPDALALFGLKKAPCHSQWFYVFRSLDDDALGRALGACALGGATTGHMAIDGQTLRGSQRRDTKALHVVSAFSTRLSVVGGDVVLEPDQNEITAALALLKQLPLEGATITGDAIFCQREICTTITDGGGDYAFVVKDNQPELKAAIALSFGELSPCDPPPAAPAEPPPDAATAPPTVEKGHGRIETRSIIASAEVVPHLSWPGAAQVARIRSRASGASAGSATRSPARSPTSSPASMRPRHRPRACSPRCGIGRRPAAVAAPLGPSPACLLTLVRDHWGIQNRLHPVRDLSMDEDRCRSRIGGRALGWHACAI